MPGPNGEPIEGDLPHKGPDGKWYNWDGSPLGEAEKEEIIKGAEGGGSSWDVGADTDMGNVIQDRPKLQGVDLNTSLADESRMGMGSLLADLQQQAITGGGAWEKSLKAATDKASASAMALGQSQPGVDYASALRNIGNAQSAVKARAVGQENILREQSKLDAQDQISGLLDVQGGQDIQQAGAAADAKHGRRSLEAARHAMTERERAQAAANTGKTVDTAFNVAGSLVGMSDGGPVPGRAPVFGNDERNDVVPARLSPGEIVIPRSHAGSPEAAADFVRALQRDRPQHFAEGGPVREWDGYDPTRPGFDLFKGNSVATQKQAAKERMGPQEDASIDNGGLLDPTQFNQNRTAVAANQQFLNARARGQGPSVAPQQMQNATDASLGAAMQVGGRGPAAGDVLHGAAGSMQGAAGQSAATTAEEQAAGQIGLGQSLAAQRGRDQAMSLAQQQAEWRNTLINSGIGLEQQALLSQIAGANSERTSRYVSGGAQGLAALAEASGSGSFDSDEKSSDDYAKGGPADLHDRNDLWAGGKVTDTRGADFVRALKRQKFA